MPLSSYDPYSNEVVFMFDANIANKIIRQYKHFFFKHTVFEHMDVKVERLHVLCHYLLTLFLADFFELFLQTQ